MNHVGHVLKRGWLWWGHYRGACACGWRAPLEWRRKAYAENDAATHVSGL